MVAWASVSLCQKQRCNDMSLFYLFNLQKKGLCAIPDQKRTFYFDCFIATPMFCEAENGIKISTVYINAYITTVPQSWKIAHFMHCLLSVMTGYSLSLVLTVLCLWTISNLHKKWLAYLKRKTVCRCNYSMCADASFLLFHSGHNLLNTV